MGATSEELRDDLCLILPVPEKDAEFLKTMVETVLKEYLHSYATLRTELKKAGFSRIRAEKWSPWPDQHLEPEMDRLFWTARKES